MSSSTRTTSASEPSKPLGLRRRWSRNFSCQRERELNRLNQVEKWRQVLESKRQDDLFERIRSRAEGPKQAGEPDGQQPVECLSVEPDGDRLLSSLEDRQAHSPVELPTTSTISSSSEKRENQEEYVGKERPPPAPLAGPSHRQQAGPPASANGKPLTEAQLIRFVSSRVPANKRVLCLIMRDKMSRLNKAKSSYFYPTYYLFVQAIVDMDEEIRVANVDHEQQQPSLLTSADQAYDDEPDLNRNLLLSVGAHRKPSSPDKNSSSTLENSFSASSSISADMLFISTTKSLKDSIGCSTPNVSSSMRGNRHSGNSYSDNEDATSGALITEPEASAQLALKRPSNASSLQGRDSPLVFPNVGPPPTGKLAQNQSTSTLKRPETSKAGTTSAKRRQLSSLSNEDEEEDEEDDEEEEEEEEEEEQEQDEDELESGARENLCRVKPPSSRVATSGAIDDLLLLFDNERNPYTGTYEVLLAGRKRKKAKTYLMGLDEFGYTRKNSICKLKSNVLGTQFTAIRLNHAENNDRCTIASISYETNVLGFKGPRKMRVFLAKEPTKGSKNLPELFKKCPDQVYQLKNMTPSWNVESQSYVLNFHGRVTQASVKNFQLIECTDESNQSAANESQKVLSWLNNINGGNYRLPVTAFFSNFSPKAN